MGLSQAALDALLRKISAKQLLSIVDSAQRRIALWSGSVSAGKTFASLIAFLIALRNAPTNGLIVIVGNSIDTIYSNVISQLLSVELFGSAVVAQISYTPGATKAIILGREVLLVGAKDALSVGRIQGKTIALAYVDEATLLKEPFWDMLVTRLRVRGARLLGTMNPASLNHFIRTKWILKADVQDVIHFHFTMYDNPSLPDWYIPQMERSFAGVFYDRMVKGIWTNAAGAVYPMWNPAKHVIPFEAMPRVTRIIGTGIDFGTTHATSAMMLGVTAEDRPRLVMMDEFRYDPADHDGQRLAPSTTAANYRTWLAQAHHPQPSPLRPEFQIIDPAAAHFQEELFKLGITTWHADNDVLPGIATISRLLENDLMVVTDRCKGWVSEVTEYRWSDKATAEGNDEPVKERDDSLDAGRYITHTARQSYEYDIAA
jgi:PBSX family phage terminase large subunit